MKIEELKNEVEKVKGSKEQALQVLKDCDLLDPNTQAIVSKIAVIKLISSFTKFMEIDEKDMDRI